MIFIGFTQHHVIVGSTVRMVTETDKNTGNDEQPTVLLVTVTDRNSRSSGSYNCTIP